VTANLLDLRSDRRLRRRFGGALLVLAVVGLSACGDDGDGEAGGSLDASSDASGTEENPRTIDVDMVDNAFEPAEVEVTAGETVRFVFSNNGAVVHDAVVGDEAAQDDHEAEMRSAEEQDGEMDEMDEMGHGSTSDEGDEEAAITVEPGEEGEITHTFDSAGDSLVGCHEPGHYAAGMKIVVNVA
jgi:uncharacterized cupredoxin-like copper-binding protein